MAMGELAFTTGLATLVTARLLLGVLESPTNPGATLVLHRFVTGASRGRAFGFLFTGGALGIALAPVLVSVLEPRIGWRGAFVGAVVFVTSGLDASPGEVLLLLAAGSRLSAYISATVGEIGFLRGIWLDGSKRLAWLENYAAAATVNEDLPAPPELRQGISLEHVSFAYPGTSRLVLEAWDQIFGG
jgi:MFS family permease